MFAENRLVPFEPSFPEGRSWVVFAPHPDDEVIGMGGTLLLAKAAGVSLTLVFMTSGDQGGAADVRKAEAESVCQYLGADAVFLGLPDRKVEVDQSSVRSVQKILREVRPDAVFVPSPQEFHPDHRVTLALANHSLRQMAMTPAIYHYEISRQSEVNQLVDITSVADEKLRLLQFYQSQLGQNNYQAVMEAMDILRTYTLGVGVEKAEGFFLYAGKQQPLAMLRERAFIGLNDAVPEDWPIVSILIRTKDRKEYLRRAVESVKQQSYASHIDLVIVNDGGESPAELKPEFESCFHRMTVVDVTTSRGRAAAANVAMNNAIGEFMNFLDDDDELDTGHVQTFLANWRRNRDIEVLYRGVRVVDYQGRHLRDFNDRYDAGRLLHMNYIPIHAVTFSRKFVDMGCRFDELLEYYEDWDFWIQLSRLARFFHTNQVTATYHLVGNSAASQHMLNQVDQVNHINRVREKWMAKSTAVEWGRAISSYIR